jgi:hypothetical protein
MLPKSKHEMRVPLGDSIHGVRRPRAATRCDQTIENKE